MSKSTVTMPKYKLTYFNLPVLSEPIKYLFHYGGIEFEDVQIKDRVNEWAKIKPTMPFGQVPVLEIDGKKYCQSLAICRYLAKQLNLVGKTDLDQLEIDGLADTIQDFRKLFGLYYREPDPVLKAKKKETLENIEAPYYLDKFEEIVKNNGGYFHGGELSYVDFFFVGLVGAFNGLLGKDVLANYTNLKSLKDKVQAIPAIKNYLKDAPKPIF